MGVWIAADLLPKKERLKLLSCVGRVARPGFRVLFLPVARYLPFIAAGSMAGRLISEKVGSLSLGATVALLVALATAVALIASRTTLRRDIA